MYQPILFDQKYIHPALLKIFTILSIPHDGTISHVVHQAQKHLLRKKGVEKWEVNPLLFKEKEELLLPLLKQLGFVDEILPIDGLYEHVVVLGFTTIDVKRNFDFIDQCIQSHVVQCKHVVLLTSSLPLPTTSKWYEPGKTEADIMKLLYQKSQLAAYPCDVITLPMVLHNGQLIRPTTGDTVIAWASKSPTPGKCLIVSAQPFIRRQTRIFQSLFDDNFSFIPMGPSAGENLPLALFLDELARSLYQEQQYRASN